MQTCPGGHQALRARQTAQQIADAAACSHAWAAIRSMFTHDCLPVIVYVGWGKGQGVTFEPTTCLVHT